AVDEARLQGADRRLADHRRRRGEVDAEEARGAGGERAHGDLDAWCDYAADEVSAWPDDVEVRGRPEVDDDAGRAVAIPSGDRVRDPVGTHLARVVVPDRHSRAYSGADDEQLRVRVSL